MPTATLPKSWFEQAAEGSPFGSMLVQAARQNVLIFSSGFATILWVGNRADSQQTRRTIMFKKLLSWFNPNT